MNQHTVIFETSLSEEALHELLCKAIHEGDADALSELQQAVTDIKDQQ